MPAASCTAIVHTVSSANDCARVGATDVGTAVTVVDTVTVAVDVSGTTGHATCTQYM